MAMTFPVAALLRRELVTSLRRQRSFVILALFVGVCIAGIGMGWPEGTRLTAGLAQLSQELVTRVAQLLFVACVLLVPALAAGAVVVEREQETLDLLRITLMQPRALLLAKLISTVGFFLLLLVAAVPIFATALFLVGMEWGALARVVLMLTATAAACAAAGLMCSARSRSITRAVFASYIALFAFMATGPIFGFVVALILGLFQGNIERYIIDYTLAIGTPYGALSALLQDKLPLLPFLMALAYQLLFAVACLGLGLEGLYKPPVPPRLERFKPIDDQEVLRRRRRTFPYYLIDPLKRKKLIEDGRNPVLVRELRWGILDRATTLIRVFYVAFLVYLFIGGAGFFTGLSGRHNYGFALGWMLTQIAGTVLVAPAVLANTFTREYEAGNMDMLRMTLLRPFEIVVGKLFAGVTAVAPLVLAAIGSAIPLLPKITEYLELLLTGYLTLLLCAAVCLALSLFASLLTTHTTTALVLSYLFTFFAFLGSWVLFTLLPVDDTSLFALLKSPIQVFAETASDHQGRELFTSLWVGNQTLFWALAALLVAVAVQGFARYRLREA